MNVIIFIALNQLLLAFAKLNLLVQKSRAKNQMKCVNCIGECQIHRGFCNFSNFDSHKYITQLNTIHNIQ